MTKALLVPCSQLEPVRLVDIGKRSKQGDKLRELVGGWIERAGYDLDADVWVDEEGKIKHRALNERATDYIFTKSDAFKQGRLTEADRPYYYLAGDAVFTGLADARGDITDVPARLVEEFGLSLDQGVTL